MIVILPGTVNHKLESVGYQNTFVDLADSFVLLVVLLGALPIRRAIS